MTTRRNLTPKQRRDMLARQGRACAVCDAPIDGTGKTCIAEHWTPVALGNTAPPDCLLCLPCAARKTNGTRSTSYGSDRHAIAKIDRITGKTGNGPKKKIAQPANPWPPRGSRKISSRPMEREGRR